MKWTDTEYQSILAFQSWCGLINDAVSLDFCTAVLELLSACVDHKTGLRKDHVNYVKVIDYKGEPCDSLIMPIGKGGWLAVKQPGTSAGMRMMSFDLISDWLKEKMPEGWSVPNTNPNDTRSNDYLPQFTKLYNGLAFLARIKEDVYPKTKVTSGEGKTQGFNPSQAALYDQRFVNPKITSLCRQPKAVGQIIQKISQLRNGPTGESRAQKASRLEALKRYGDKLFQKYKISIYNPNDQGLKSNNTIMNAIMVAVKEKNGMLRHTEYKMPKGRYCFYHHSFGFDANQLTGVCNLINNGVNAISTNVQQEIIGGALPHVDEMARSHGGTINAFEIMDTPGELLIGANRGTQMGIIANDNILEDEKRECYRVKTKDGIKEIQPNRKFRNRGAIIKCKFPTKEMKDRAKHAKIMRARILQGRQYCQPGMMLRNIAKVAYLVKEKKLPAAFPNMTLQQQIDEVDKHPNPNTTEFTAVLDLPGATHSYTMTGRFPTAAPILGHRDDQVTPLPALSTIPVDMDQSDEI